ncbi:hypothetical protein QYF61_003974 [Mycteria americana]|uniref:Uncharacterized protein n=1 Tax=Mycteria americana TaxID=33587 RepID=A0AAN7NNX3_MYCAM|nr:hypothetical protein QYF61_003974 [Mycteria americana]
MSTLLVKPAVILKQKIISKQPPMCSSAAFGVGDQTSVKACRPGSRARQYSVGAGASRGSPLGCRTASHQPGPVPLSPAKKQGRLGGCPWVRVRIRPGEGNQSQIQPHVAEQGHEDGNGLRLVQEVNLWSGSGSCTGSKLALSFSNQTLKECILRVRVTSGETVAVDTQTRVTKETTTFKPEMPSSVLLEVPALADFNKAWAELTDWLSRLDREIKSQRVIVGDLDDINDMIIKQKTKQPQFPQPLLISLVLQTLHQLHCPSLDTLQHLNVSLVVRGPKLNTVFEAAFQSLFHKSVALHGVVVTQVQDPAHGLVEPHTIDLSPSLQPVQIPLQSLPTLKQINTPAQFGVICKLTEVEDVVKNNNNNKIISSGFRKSKFSQAILQDLEQRRPQLDELITAAQNLKNKTSNQEARTIITDRSSKETQHNHLAKITEQVILII